MTPTLADVRARFPVGSAELRELVNLFLSEHGIEVAPDPRAVYVAFLQLETSAPRAGSPAKRACKIIAPRSRLPEGIASRRAERYML